MVNYVEMHKDGNLKLSQRDSPELEEGSVLLETIYSELCGTDIHISKNKLEGVPYPIIPGHVSVGKVSKTNGVVFDIMGNKIIPGKNVAFLDVHETCGHCYQCLVAKATTRCPKRKVYGITYSSTDGLLGGWSEEIYLKPGVKILIIPDNFDPKNFIAGGCGLPTAIHAIQRAQIPLGSTVLIQGSGSVGIMCALMAKLSGAYHIIMTGAPEFRLEIAKKFGVQDTINIEKFSSQERLEKIHELTDGRGTDITVEASGNPYAVSEGIKATRDAGRMCVVGQYTDNGSIEFNPHLDLNKKHLDLVGSWGSDFSHFYLALKTVIRFEKDYPWHELISKEYGLSQLSEALNDLESLKILKGVVNPKL
ncbi:MAG: 5-exo-hydroxycamphor dehydrogenase [Candidatus Heimdallarchaeota archaeon LC_3]|nr:MAG: 5-exo-hydroxycamphor dehydrogenase [Candidatus Heimdallarchaeota archaeon LC_3]